MKLGGTYLFFTFNTFKIRFINAYNKRCFETLFKRNVETLFIRNLNVLNKASLTFFMRWIHIFTLPLYRYGTYRMPRVYARLDIKNSHFYGFQSSTVRNSWIFMMYSRADDKNRTRESSVNKKEWQEKSGTEPRNQLAKTRIWPRKSYPTRPQGICIHLSELKDYPVKMYCRDF